MAESNVRLPSSYAGTVVFSAWLSLNKFTQCVRDETKRIYRLMSASCLTTALSTLTFNHAPMLVVNQVVTRCTTWCSHPKAPDDTLTVTVEHRPCKMLYCTMGCVHDVNQCHVSFYFMNLGWRRLGPSKEDRSISINNLSSSKVCINSLRY